MPASQAGRRRFESGRPLSGSSSPDATSVASGFFVLVVSPVPDPAIDGAAVSPNGVITDSLVVHITVIKGDPQLTPGATSNGMEPALYSHRDERPSRDHLHLTGTSANHRARRSEAGTAHG